LHRCHRCSPALLLLLLLLLIHQQLLPCAVYGTVQAHSKTIMPYLSYAATMIAVTAPDPFPAAGVCTAMLL
jgi:hypothetical protein